MKYFAVAMLGATFLIASVYADDAHAGHTMVTSDQMQWGGCARLAARH
jgi:hypothetical protein